MKNLFLIRFRDGGIKATELKVTKSGLPTKDSIDSLVNQGYVSYCNLTNTLQEVATEKELKLVATAIGLL